MGRRQYPRGGDGEHDADRHVDEENPPPREVVGNQAAKEQAEGAAGSRYGRVGAQRAVAPAPFWKRVGDQRQRGWSDDRGPDALRSPGDDQPGRRGGKPSREGTEREQEHAGDEHAAPSEQIAGATAEEQQAAECQGITVDYPLQAGWREVQSPLDRRQRDVHDRGVEHHHELCDRDDDEGEAEAAGLRRWAANCATSDGNSSSHGSSPLLGDR